MATAATLLIFMSKIKKFDEVIEEVEELVEDLGEAEIIPVNRSDTDLHDDRQEVIKDIIAKINEGIAWSEKGVERYFHSNPKRAVEFQQNHISYLELKAKVLGLLKHDGTQAGNIYQQQNNIIVDNETAKNLCELLAKRLYKNES